MAILVIEFCVATLLLGWLLFGYAIWLRFQGDRRKRPQVEPLRSFPRMSVIVPCLNEEGQIAEKYGNLAACEYPPEKLEVLFADGGSNDGTGSILESLAQGDGRIQVVACPVAGKINQLNHVLPMATGEIVVVTDADSRLEPHALAWLAAHLEADPRTAVVGAVTMPRGGLAVEQCFWAAQNRMRLLESSVSHVSTVTACCYAFKRELLTHFPDDVIADDVYVVALANMRGYHTAYCPEAFVEELRTPLTLPEFFTHKFRKNNAVLREMLRFVHRLPDMPRRWKTILTTRIVQQFLLPWGTVLWIGSGATLACLGQIDVVLMSMAWLLVMLFATRKATLAIELPGEAQQHNVMTVILAYCYTMAVLSATALTYPYFRQTSCYQRLTGRSIGSHAEGEYGRGEVAARESLSESSLIGSPQDAPGAADLTPSQEDGEPMIARNARSDEALVAVGTGITDTRGPGDAG